MAQTEKWFFPTVVHLRMRDQSLLKFAPGPRDVPVDLPEEEKKILLRNGAKPISQVSKEAIAATEKAQGADATEADKARAAALHANAPTQDAEKQKELTDKAAKEKAAKDKEAADKAKAEAEKEKK